MRKISISAFIIAVLLTGSLYLVNQRVNDLANKVASLIKVGASQSISSLTELTSLSHNDVLPITEVNGLTTKKVKWGTATSTLKVINDALYSPIIGSASITTLGTITTGTWNADTLTVAKGGTGSTSLIAYQLLAGNGTGAVTTFGNGTSGYVLTSNGAGALPSFQNVGVTTNNNNTWTGTNTFTATSTFTSDTIGSISALYGDGSDGIVTITSGTTTLTRDMYYDSLTVNNGATVTPSSFRIFVKNTLTVSGAISGNGMSGTAGTDVASCVYGGGCPASASVAGVGGTSTGGYLGFAPNGGKGGNGGGTTCSGADGTNGSSGSIPTLYSFTLNSGGTGGNGGAGAQVGGCSYTPATGGASTSPSTILFKVNNFLAALHPFSSSSPIVSAGASGGGAGGSGSSCSGCSGPAVTVGGAGGGAGANGSPVQIFARTVTITSTGIISSNGGNGGKGGNGGSVSGGTNNLGAGGGGGGAGGSGGWVQIVTSSYTNTGTLSANAGVGGTYGTGGTGSTGNGANGTAGANGSAGVTAVIIQ